MVLVAGLNIHMYNIRVYMQTKRNLDIKPGKNYKKAKQFMELCLNIIFKYSAIP